MNKYYRVTLAHAVGAENGTQFGKKGNQSGDELRFQFWYDRAKGWHTVLRCTDKAKQKLIAKDAIRGVRNKNIGYSQDETRYSLWVMTKPYGFDNSKADKPCNCDCSSFVANNVAFSGITNFEIKDFYTGNMVSRLSNTKAFKMYTANKYIKTYESLKVGDILVGAGHTATVVNTVYWLKTSLSKESATNSRTADVKALQARLNDLGDYGLVVDGEFGNRTDSALKAFQRTHNLKVDGVVGKTTASELGFLFG